MQISFAIIIASPEQLKHIETRLSSFEVETRKHLKHLQKACFSPRHAKNAHQAHLLQVNAVIAVNAVQLPRVHGPLT